MRRTWKPVVEVTAGGILLSMAVIVDGSSVAGASTTQVVKQLQVSSWFGFTEGPGRSLGNVTLVSGPSTPPLGTGSAKLGSCRSIQPGARRSERISTRGLR